MSASALKVEEITSSLHDATGDFGINSSPEHEQFVGFQLTGEENEHVWDPEVTPVMKGLPGAISEDGGTSMLQGVSQYSRLLVKQAILSPEAKEGEMNCVEVEGSFPRSLNNMPLAILVGGKEMQRYLDVYFPEPPLTFRLTHGTGPVYILAQSMIENCEDSDDDGIDTADDGEDEAEEEAEDEDEGEEEAEAEESPEKPKKKKGAAKSPAKSKAKRKRSAKEEDEEEDDESEEEEASPPKKKGRGAKPAAKSKSAKMEVEDDEEEAESEEEVEPPKKKSRAAPKAKGGRRR